MRTTYMILAMATLVAAAWRTPVRADEPEDVSSGGPAWGTGESPGERSPNESSDPAASEVELAADDRPEPLPVAPAAAAPLPAPSRTTRVSGSDEFLRALWRMQERIDQLEHENHRLAANVNQLQTHPAWAGRSPRFFQVSPLRSAALDDMGVAPVHYESELAALEQVTPPSDVPLAPECDGVFADGYGYGLGHFHHADGCQDGCLAGNFEFSIDWLNWKTNRDGLDYVVTGDDNDVLGPGNLKHVRHGRDNGIRLGLFRRLHSGWDFGIRYIEFDLQGSSSVADLDGNPDLSPTRIHPSLAGADIRDDVTVVADSDYDLQYDVIDLEAGRSFGIGPSGAVRPFAGLRTARIDQDLDTRYSDTPDFSGNVVLVNEKANTSTVGMLFGSEAHWHVRGRWTVFGRAAAGLHVGTTDVSHVETEPDDGDVNVDVKEDLRSVLLSLESAAGVGCRVWDRSVAVVDVQVGYEIHYWDNLPDFMRFVDDANEGLNDRSTTSLGLDGFFGRIVITR